MTYRSDHEAALARVDALEHELAQLRDKATVAQPPEHHSKLLLLVACLAAAGGLFVGLWTVTRASDKPVSAPVAVDQGGRSGTVAVDGVDRSGLVRCVEAVELTPLLTAEETDPHRYEPRRITLIAPTAAPCREELHTIAELSLLSPNEQLALSRWAKQEDELAGAIARIETYYANDPYKLDNYTSARQLWREYDRAHDNRDIAMQYWRKAFAKL